MERMSFIAAHYGALLLFAASCWGFGWTALQRTITVTPMTRALAASLCLGLGAAVIMLMVQLVALAGLLRAPWLLCLLGVGWFLAGFGLLRCWRMRTAQPRARSHLRLHWTVWLVLLLTLCTVLLPLRPPHMWDELSFHLAHAQQWARSGRFQINEWLRYPWSPLGYQLLFASALVLYDDVMPHLLHAFAGWTAALLLYQIALRYSNRIVAATAAVVWLALARESFLNAYVDMAVALYLLSALTAFTLWRAQPVSRGWLAAGAFLLGSAAAIKYQALGFFPYFALVLLLNRPQARSLAVALAFGLLPCAYWYARNALLTGDPFNPLGGAVFGFNDWNAKDMALQLFDIRNGYGWPPMVLWPTLAAPLLATTWRNAGLRAALYFSVCAAVVWLTTSHLPRYLLPTYPVLALLAAHAVWTVIDVLTQLVLDRTRPAGGFGPLARGRARGAAAVILLLLAVPVTARLVQRDWDLVAATPAQRATFLDRQMWEYRGVLGFLHKLPNAHIYQFGMEAALYYAPQPIWGDHFGPWRYRDFVTLPPAPLAAKLRDHHFDTLVVQLKFIAATLEDSRFQQCFDTLYKDHTFGVYRVLPAAKCNAEPDLPSRHTKAPDTPFVIGPSLPNDEKAADSR